MRKSALFAVVAMATVVAMSVAPAWAGTVIEFFGGTGGSITLLADGSLAGDDISIASMYVSGAPQNNGSAPVLLGVLSFYTGGSAGASFISLTGSVLGVTGELLSGTISDWLGSSAGIAATGQDFKSGDLLQVLGVSPGTLWEFFALSISWAGSGSPTFSYLKNTQASTGITSVPEANSLLLLGIALGWFELARRRCKRSL